MLVQVVFLQIHTKAVHGALGIGAAMRVAHSECDFPIRNMEVVTVDLLPGISERNGSDWYHSSTS